MAFVGKQVVEKPNLGVGFIALFVCLGALTVRGIWSVTFSPILQLLVRGFSFSIAGARPLLPLARAVANLDNAVYRALGNAIEWSGRHFVQLVMWLAYTVTMIGVALGAIVYELLLALHVLHRRTSPTFVQQAVGPLVKPIETTTTKTKVVQDTRVPAIEHEIAGVRGRLDVQQREIDHLKSIAVPAPIPYRWPVPRTVPTPAPVPVPRTQPRVGELAGSIGRLWGKVKDLSKLGTVAGLLGLVGVVAGRLGFGWVRCSKVGQAGRSLCGMNQTLLDALLAGSALVVGGFSLRELANGTLEAMDAIAGAVKGNVRELKGVQVEGFAKRAPLGDGRS